MKKILIIAFAVFGYFTKAQQQELLENTWYLEKFIVDDIVFYPPNNEEVSPEDIQLIIFENNLTTYSGCNWLDGPIIINQEENYFESSEGGFGQSLAECQYSYNNQFEYDYFGFFQNFINGVLDPFYYEINSNGEALSLVVTNSEGSKAYYNNAEMSVSDVTELNKGEFQVVFQNENLIIKNRGSRAESVSIYDLNGKMLLSNSVSSEGIVSTAQLPKGIYIIRLTDENGNVFSKKLRKP
jgi:hypothetical protein